VSLGFRKTRARAPHSAAGISRPPSRCNALDAKILGFSNRWYADALRTAAEVHLRGGLICVLSPPYFLGTKIEAFRGRGRGDYFASHDLEDFITVMDGRTSLFDEVEAASAICADLLEKR